MARFFVYTGILPICGDEDGLAAVLGHEIAHLATHHPAESMSNDIIRSGTTDVTSLAGPECAKQTRLLHHSFYAHIHQYVSYSEE